MEREDIVERLEAQFLAFLAGLFTGESKVVITKIRPGEANDYTEGYEISLRGPSA